MLEDIQRWAEIGGYRSEEVVADGEEGEGLSGQAHKSDVSGSQSRCTTTTLPRGCGDGERVLICCTSRLVMYHHALFVQKIAIATGRRGEIRCACEREGALLLLQEERR